MVDGDDGRRLCGSTASHFGYSTAGEDDLVNVSRVGSGSGSR